MPPPYPSGVGDGDEYARECMFLSMVFVVGAVGVSLLAFALKYTFAYLKWFVVAKDSSNKDNFT